MSHLIIVKYFQRGTDDSTLEIALDKELASLITVLPTDTIKRFATADGQKGVYRTHMSSLDQDFLSILKALRAMRWHTISSHVIVRSNGEETRFYMERELHRTPGSSDHSTSVDDHATDKHAHAQLPLRQAPRPAGSTQVGEDGRIKRPTLSPEAVANLIANGTTVAQTATPTPFGFSQRPSLVTRRPAPGSDNPAPGSPSNAADHSSQTTDSPPAHTAPSTASHALSTPSPAPPAAPSHHLLPHHLPHGAIQRGALPGQPSTLSPAASLPHTQPHGHPSTSLPQQRTPPPLVGRGNPATAANPSQPAASGTMGVVAGFAQRILLRSASNQALSPSAAAPPSSAPVGAHLPGAVPTAVAAVPASVAPPQTAAAPPAASEQSTAEAMAAKPAEGKNPNSVVNKLLGKYNRKSFISTTKIALPPTDEDGEAPPPETAPPLAAVPASGPPAPASHPPPSSEPSAALPVAVAVAVPPPAPAVPPPPPSYDTVTQAPPPYSSLPSAPVADDLDAFLSVNAQSVEESQDVSGAMGHREDERTVHFSKKDLLSPGKYSPIQRDAKDAHEVSKTQHYSRLGSAFVNESSLNSLMGRGRGGRLGSMHGRSGMGRGFT